MTLKDKFSYGVLGVLAFGGIVLADRTSSDPLIPFNRQASAPVISKNDHDKALAELAAFLKPMQDRGRAERQLRCGDKRDGTVSYARKMGGEDAIATMHCADGSISFVYPK